MSSSRRQFLAAAAVLWEQAVLTAQQDVNRTVETQRKAHEHGPATLDQRPKYAYGFLTAREQATLRRLADRIVPADERSGGAAAARVEEYVDFILSNGEPTLRQVWRTGLARQARRIAGKSPQQVDAWLLTLAANEFSPATADEQFFVLLKGAVTEGFYTSEEGIEKELDYQGLGFLREFPGCTHEFHTAPAGYQPLLRSRS